MNYDNVEIHFMMGNSSSKSINLDIKNLNFEKLEEKIKS